MLDVKNTAFKIYLLMLLLLLLLLYIRDIYVGDSYIRDVKVCLDLITLGPSVPIIRIACYVIV
jgi:hypothetical protein